MPSLLLNNRIVYVGAPLVPQVAELIVAQLLFLNFESQEKGVYMYINSPGSGSFETDAFAILDTMNYVGPDMETICIGSAYGTAAMLLANGAKGKRSCLPNSTIMLSQPRSQARGQASDIRIKAREVLTARNTISQILSEKTGQPVEKVSACLHSCVLLPPRDDGRVGSVEGGSTGSTPHTAASFSRSSNSADRAAPQINADSSRTRYMNPEQALAYGLVDRVLRSEQDLPAKPAFLAAL